MTSQSRARLLHLAVWDPKYIGPANQSFARLEFIENTWRYFRISTQRTDPSGARSPSFHEYLESGQCAADLASTDAVVLHSLSPAFSKVLEYVPTRVVTWWLAWGFDYREAITAQLHSRFLPETQAWRDRRRRTLTSIIRSKYTRLKRMTGRSLRIATPRYERIDFTTMSDFELEVVKRHWPQLRATRMSVNYLLSETVFRRGPQHRRGPVVQLGNSSHLNGNLLDALSMLESALPDYASILCPLNYGDRAYAKAVRSKGRRVFGDRFRSIDSWMPLASYNQCLAGSGVLLVNSRVQMGLGTIYDALYRGASVILRAENPIVRHLTNIGLVTYTPDQLISGEVPLTRSPDHSIATNNRNIIDRRMSFTSFSSNVEAFCSRL